MVKKIEQLNENWHNAEYNESNYLVNRAEIDEFIRTNAIDMAAELEKFPEKGFTIEQVKASMRLYHENAMKQSRHAA